MAEDNSISLILDTGSWLCRAGLSNEDVPRVSIPTLVSNYKTINKDNQSTYYFGKEALEKSPTLGIQNIIKEGIVEDWELLEIFWQKLIANNFPTDAVEKPILTNFYPNSSKFMKEKAAQIFFETFNVPLYYTISNSLAILYSSGRINGLVIDSGHSITSAVPIIDGTPLYYGQSILNFGGIKITDYLQKETNLSRDLCHELKEKYCRISLDFEKEISELKANPNASIITLPDGSTFDFKTNSIQSTESIFKEETGEEEHFGIQHLINSSYLKCDVDYRKELLNNILIAGGNTCFSNFNERLQKELFVLVPSIVKVKCLNLNDRVNASWLGQAIISSLGSFQPMWVTRSDYEECGPSIINRKCI